MKLIKEMDELPRYLTSDNFNLVVKKLKANSKVIFIDEIDYLMNNFKTVLKFCGICTMRQIAQLL